MLSGSTPSATLIAGAAWWKDRASGCTISLSAAMPRTCQAAGAPGKQNGVELMDPPAGSRATASGSATRRKCSSR